MGKPFARIAAVLGALGVGLGAFGAHGLAGTLTANGRVDTFETAVQYHLVHTLALLGVALLLNQSGWRQRRLRYAGWLFVVGVLLFSGSLYMLAVFDLRFMGAVAPFGGAALIVGWLVIGASSLQ